MNDIMLSKILILGKNGQVGYELCRTMATLGEIYAIDVDECDLTDKESILENLDKFRPNVIANSAAYTAVDKAEIERELAFKLNANAPGIIADWAAKNKALMVHYSTDYVFDGTKDGPWTEEDKPDPLNVYGESKLAGDINIQNSGCNHFIFRTSWVYGARGKNFYLTMKKLLQEKDELRIVDDQFGAPTWCRTIAEATAQVISQIQSPLFSVDTKKLSGIYNLTNSGVTTWYRFTEAIKQYMLEEFPNGKKYAKLYPIQSNEYKTAAKRPTNSTLSLNKISNTFALNPCSWENALKNIINEVQV